MRKIKLILTMFITALGVFASTLPAAAADPGCYAASGTPDNPQYSSTTCPSENYARAVSQFSACYVVSGSTATERDCADLNQTASNVPPSGSYSGPSSGTSTAGTESLDSDCNEATLDADNCQIVRYLVVAINLLSALAGMAIVGSIMFAGFQYMTARDNSGQVEAAKKRIIWALAALGIFIFTYAALNWLVPGGVL